jgi:hypothetical protein
MRQEVQKILVQFVRERKNQSAKYLLRLLANGKKEPMKCVHQSATRY